jgi:hypothetical protein
VPLKIVLRGVFDALIGLDENAASQPHTGGETVANEPGLLVPEEDALASAAPSPFAPFDPGFTPTTYEAPSDAPTFAAADETATGTPGTPAPAATKEPG